MSNSTTRGLSQFSQPTMFDGCHGHLARASSRAASVSAAARQALARRQCHPLYHSALLLAALLIFCAGCAEPGLLLHCGAGIRPAADELADAFEKQSGVKIERSYAGSEALVTTIRLARRGDLFMPGDVHYVDQASEEGLIASQQNACYFVPVILVQKDNPKNIRGLADLARPGVKVGLGDPNACAIGRKAAKIFKKNKLDKDVEKNVVFRSLTVNELGDKIKLKHLDAAVVWDAVAVYFADDTETVPIDSEKNVISTVAIGVLTCSEHPALAVDFADFVASEKGKEIFRKHHYTTRLPE